MKNQYLNKLFALAIMTLAMATMTNAQFTVDAPASIAGTYNNGTATFGPQFSGFSGMVVPATDTDGLTTACVAVDNSVADVTGAVALVDRGGCNFFDKALNAQAAGAIGVIVCNNDTDNPDDVINLGGNDGCAVTIPTVMLSYNDCQTIRMEMGVMATYTAPGLPGAGENFATAIDITEGTYTVDSITGTGGIFNGSTGAAWYKYTPAADGVVRISSCGSPTDTRLILTVAPAGCVGDVQIAGFNDDAGAEVCADNEFASELENLVFAGQEYYIVWDDPWSNDGFDFVVELLPLPTVPVTVTVNMEQETVDPAGVSMLYAIGAGGVTPQTLVLTDNGDGTWSGTVDVMTLDTFYYIFENGAPLVGPLEVLPDECSVFYSDGNLDLRSYVNTAIEPVELAPVCFSLCTNCPVVNVTYTVDMTNTGASPDGVSMVVGGPGVTDVGDVELFNMTDNGDGTWSVTIERMTGDTLGYAFLNGALDPANLEMVPEECGLPSGFGFNIRPQIVEGFDDITMAPVCFSTCSSFCPDLGCATPATVMENMDSYELGSDITTQSDLWVLWPVAGVIGGEVSDEQAASPPHSVKLEGGGDTGAGTLVDPLLNLGAVSAGSWDVRFKMFIPEGNGGYYNIQNNESADPTQWNVQVAFGIEDAFSDLFVSTDEYPAGEWFDVVNVIDIDNQRGEIIINGVSLYTWTYGPDFSIGAFNFYPRDANDIYYIDDIVMRPIELNGMACPEGSIICDGLESFADGPVSDQSAHWAPWTSSPANDGLVTEELAFEGCKSLKITDEDPDDQLLLLGDRTEGNYLLEWQMYIPDGNLGYFNLQKFEVPNTEFGMQVEYFADGTATLDAGAADVVTFDWAADTWQKYQFLIDLDNDYIIMLIDDIVIYEWPFNWTSFTTSGSVSLGSIDFFGNTNCAYYLDNILFQQLPSVPGNACAGAEDIQSNLGGGLGVVVSSGPYDNTNYTTTSQDPDFGWECFGEPDGSGGAPSLERTRWFTFVGDGESYFIEAVECGDDPIDFGDTQFVIYSGSDCSNLEAVLCSDDGPNAQAGGPFPAGDTLQTEAGVVYYIMTDGFGPDFPADGEFCMEFTQLSTTTQLTASFSVDAALLVDAGTFEGTMFIAGAFSGWENVEMNDADGDNVWTVDILVDPNMTYEYKFKNGPDGWEEGIPEDCTLGGYGNRFFDATDVDIVLDEVCFNYCVTCDEVSSVDDFGLSAGVEVFPNPANELLNIRIDLAESADNLSIRMLNTFGQVVNEQYLGQYLSGNIEIDLTDIPAGAYMIQVRDGNAQYTHAVVVQK